MIFSRIKDALYITALVVAALVVAALTAKCQSPPTLRQIPPQGTANGIEYLLTTLGVPCEPGSLQFGFWPCPPVQSQGLLIHLRPDPKSDKPDNSSFDRYIITVGYIAADGQSKELLRVADRRKDGDQWTAIALETGRIKTAELPGVVVTGIVIERSTIAAVLTP